METSGCLTFLVDGVSWSWRAAAFYGCGVKGVTHQARFTCLHWVPTGICTPDPSQGVYLGFLWVCDSLYSLVCCSFLSDFNVHLYLVCVCMINKRKEAIFQRPNMCFINYIHMYFYQGSFHFKLNILLILIFRKILANM